MINAPRYLLLGAIGIAAIGWGLPASQRLRKPWDSLAAVAVLAGVILIMLGALLSVLPAFFLE